MISKQITESRYWLEPGEAQRIVQVGVEVDDHPEDDVDVDIESTFESGSLGRWTDMVYRQVHNGVHEGIGAAGFPLPKTGLLVRITRLTVDPRVTNDTQEAEALAAGTTIRALVSATVNSQLHRMQAPVSFGD